MATNETTDNRPMPSDPKVARQFRRHDMQFPGGWQMCEDCGDVSAIASRIERCAYCGGVTRRRDEVLDECED